MALKNDYRTRCYAAYHSTRWQISHSSVKPEEYRFLMKIYARRYGAHLPAPSEKLKIIDLACGAGHFLYYLQHSGYPQARGLDISEEMLEASRQAGVKNISQGDILTFLPTQKEKYDFIIANDVIEHLDREEVLEFLDLIHDALKPGGMLLLSTINTQSLFGARTIYIDFTHQLGFTPVSLTQVMRICHFQNIKVYGEVPVVHDARSAIRGWLWKQTKRFLRLLLTIESGTGRGFRKYQYIFEPRMFTLAKKEDS